MPNINSNGKFGTSMDYSQLLEIRRKFTTVNHMTQQNPENSPSIKPYFNQDKFARENGTNGAVPFYFQRGLLPIYSRIGSGK
jgi:hypothetical protein